MGKVNDVAVDTNTIVHSTGVSEDEPSVNPDSNHSNPDSDDKSIPCLVDRGIDTDICGDEDNSDNDDDGNTPALQEILAEWSGGDASNSKDKPLSTGVRRES